MSRLFPQVLHTEKETSRGRIRTIAAVIETETPLHCIVRRPKLSNDFSLESKAYPEFVSTEISTSHGGPHLVWQTFFVEEYAGTTVSGRRDI